MSNFPVKEEIVYGEVLDENFQSFIKDNNQLSSMMNYIEKQTNSLNKISQNSEYAVQRYVNAENNRQWIYNNEVSKYNDLINRQNNLLSRINIPNIKLWRFKNSLYFRTYSGQLIINNHVEIQKELSCRFGGDIFIVNDINDVLRNNNQYRVNTIFIAINNIVAVEEEVFNVNELNEIFLDGDGAWKRNLLSYTRFNKKRIVR